LCKAQNGFSNQRFVPLEAVIEKWVHGAVREVCSPIKSWKAWPQRVESLAKTCCRRIAKGQRASWQKTVRR
jgi:hypothetical protein